MKKFSIFFLLTLVAALSGQLQAQDCTSAYYPMKTGTVITLQHLDGKNKISGTSVQLVKAVQKTAHGISAEIESDFKDKNDRSTGKHSYTMVCDNGVLKLNMKDWIGNMPANQPQGSEIRMEITGDNLDLPASLSVDQDLGGGTMSMKSYMGTMKIMEMNFTIKERKVEKKESVTVPAGTFDCYKITYILEYKMMGKMRLSKSAAWYAKNAGMVKQESYTEDGKLTGSTILQSLK